MTNSQAGRGPPPAADLLLALGHLIRARDGMDSLSSFDEAVALDNTKEAVARVRSAMEALDEDTTAAKRDQEER